MQALKRWGNDLVASYWTRQKDQQILDPVSTVFMFALRNLPCYDGAKPGASDDRLDFYPAGKLQATNRLYNQVGSDDMLFCRRAFILFLKGWSRKDYPELERIVDVVIKGLNLQAEQYRNEGNIAAVSCEAFAFCLQQWKIGKVVYPTSQEELIQGYIQKEILAKIPKPAKAEPIHDQAMQYLGFALENAKISVFPPDHAKDDDDAIKTIKEQVWSRDDFRSFANDVSDLTSKSETLKTVLTEKHIHKYKPIVIAANKGLKASS